MNPNITSKEEILAVCRQLAQKEGLSAVTMRNVAAHCGTALGSLYNYFPSKDDLILETITSIWQSIFHFEKPPFQEDNFLSVVAYFEESLDRGATLYPGFFNLHSLSFASGEKEKGRERRDEVFAHMKGMMKRTLDQDKKVRKDAFKTMDETNFIDVVFLAVVYSRLEKVDDRGALNEMIKRSLY